MKAIISYVTFLARYSGQVSITRYHTQSHSFVHTFSLHFYTTLSTISLILSDQEVCLHRHLLRPTVLSRYPGQPYQLGLKQLTALFLLYAIYKAG